MLSHLNRQLQENLKRQKELEKMIEIEKTHNSRLAECGTISNLTTLIEDQNKHLDQKINKFRTPRELANIRFSEQKEHYSKMNKQDPERYSTLVYPIKECPTRSNECFSAILGILISQDARIKKLECERNHKHTATSSIIDDSHCPSGFMVNKN